MFIAREQLDELIRHVEEYAPLEACGLLAGCDGHVEKVIPITNAEASPVRFRMEPLEQLRAFEWIESQGLDLLGIFHSHPAGPEMVSPTDIAEAAYEVAHIILSRRDGTWIARGFKIQNGQAMEISLHVE